MAATLLTCLLFPAGASADLSWQPLATLSIGGANADRADVEMSSTGEAVDVWRRLGANLIDASLRPAGGNFAQPGVQIDGGSTSNDNHRAAMGPGAQAQVVWQGYPGGSGPTTSILGAARSAGGGFGARALVSTSSSGDTVDFDPDTAVDASGNALSVWSGRASGVETIRSTFRAAAGNTWSTPPQYAAQNLGSTAYKRPRLAMRGQGDAVVVWSWQRGTTGVNSDPVDDVLAAYRTAGASGTWDATSTPLCQQVTSAGPTCATPQVAMSGQGTALAAWVNKTPSSATGTIQASIRSAGGSGTWASTPNLATGSSNPQVAMDAQGNGIAVWQRPGAGRIEVAYRPAGGSFGAAVPISAAGQTSSLPRVAMFNGTAVVAWLQDDGNKFHIMAAYSVGNGSFETPFDLSAQDDADRPDVAMDGTGNAIVTWDGFDGANNRVFSRIGVAPGNIPPPPPPPPPVEPPPPPPVPGVPTVSALRLARPIERDHAVIMTAEVAGPVERLSWGLDGASVTGTTIGGHLQRSVRFRPDGGPFTVRVQASGAGRTGPALTRTYTMPKSRASAAASSAADINRVHAALERAPRVAAAGDPSVLLGKTNSCAIPTTVSSVKLDMTGCFAPVENLADIPSAERGVLQPLASELHLPLSDGDLMRTAVEQTDGYLTKSPIPLEGNFPLVPNGGASIISLPQANAITSSNAGLKIGGYQFGQKGGFVLNIDPRKQGIGLPALPRPPSLPKLGGFPLVGDFDVKLVNGEAQINGALKLPSFLKTAGVDIQASVKLRATPDRLIFDAMTIGPINVDLGALAVKQFRISYFHEGNDDLWQGQGKACIISGICLDMVPPNGQVKIRNGNLDFAGASLGFGTPGIPLFSGVNLERIGFGFGLTPTRFTGNAKLVFSQLLVIDGRLVLAFPTDQEPFFLRRDEVGNDFPAKLYTYRYTGTTIGLSANAALRIPVVGDLPLASAYMLYEYPGYAALGGGMSYAVRDPITKIALVSVDGRLDGEFNAGNGRFNIDGHISACVVDVICKGVDGNVSSRGMSICTSVNLLIHSFHVGAAIRWSPFDFIPYLDGCVWGRFREANVRAARLAQAGGSYTVQVKAGDPSRMVMLNGASDAPLVRVSGPGGQVLDAPAGAGLVSTPDSKIRIMRSSQARFVAVAFARAKPGTYKIELLPGSVPIAKVRESTALPPARVTGRVTGTGDRRVLKYNIATRPDQVVTFHDLGADGAGKQIGTVRSGGRGEIRFSPAPGNTRRTIKARFEIDGFPAEEVTVASFRPPSPRLAKPSRLRTKRLKRNRLRVSWNRVAGAARYELVLTASTGRQRFTATRRTSVVLRGVPASLAGRLSVRAVAPLRHGLPGTARLRAAARRRTALSPLLRCRAVKKRIVCSRR